MYTAYLDLRRQAEERGPIYQICIINLGLLIYMLFIIFVVIIIGVFLYLIIIYILIWFINR